MTLKDILFGGGSALFMLLTLLQLAPIKINPWSAIAKAFGRAINSEVLEKVGKLESELQCVRSGMAEEKAVNCRARILRFGDECLHGERHTKDHFDQTLRDIAAYERYCEDHPEFENNVTELTSDRIKTIYRRCLDSNDFLQDGGRTMNVLDMTIIRLAAGLVLLIAANIALGSINAIIDGEWDQAKFRNGCIKSAVVAAALVAVYFAGYLNPDLMVVEVDGQTVNLMTAVSLAMLAAFTAYAVDVLKKLKDMLSTATPGADAAPTALPSGEGKEDHTAPEEE